MPDYLITTDRALLARIAETVDLAEGYHVSVRRPGNVTERHADIDEHPDSSAYAYLCDSVVVRHLQAVRDRVEPGQTVTKWRELETSPRDGTKQIEIASGEFSGRTLARAEKDATWQREENDTGTGR